MGDEGYRVLLIDLDPQGSLTFSLGVDPEALEVTIHDVMMGNLPIDKVTVKAEGVTLAPANIELAAAEMFLYSKTGREYVLKQALEEVHRDFDAILIDCPPSLGILTINGLTAATDVIIPFQCETLSQRGVAQLLETINDVRRYTNQSLKVRGIIATMFDPRTTHSREVLEQIGERYSIPVFDPPVRKSIRFAEAPRKGMTILQLAPKHPGAEAYRTIARALL